MFLLYYFYVTKSHYVNFRVQGSHHHLYRGGGGGQIDKWVKKIIPANIDAKHMKFGVNMIPCSNLYLSFVFIYNTYTLRNKCKNRLPYFY